MEAKSVHKFHNKLNQSAVAIILCLQVAIQVASCDFVYTSCRCEQLKDVNDYV